MTWAFRSGSYANDGLGGSVTTGGTGTVTLGTALSSGDAIVLHIGAFNTAGGNPAPTFAVSDSVNGSWGSAEAATGTVALGTQNARGSIWIFPNSAAGTPTITVTFTATGGSGINFGLQVAAFSGVVTSSPTDATAAGNGTGTTATSGNTSTSTTAANELMVGAYWDAGENDTLTAGNIAGAAATLAGKHDADGGKWEGLFEYGDSGASSGTPSATVTVSATNSGWVMVAAVFKVTAGGGGGGGGAAPSNRRLLLGVG